MLLMSTGGVDGREAEFSSIETPLCSFCIFSHARFIFSFFKISIFHASNKAVTLCRLTLPPFFSVRRTVF